MMLIQKRSLQKKKDVLISSFIGFFPPQETYPMARESEYWKYLEKYKQENEKKIKAVKNDNESNIVCPKQIPLQKATVFHSTCVWLQGVLSMQDQYALYEAVLKAAKCCRPEDLKNKNKYSSKLMVLNPSNPYHYKQRYCKIYDDLLSSVSHILWKQCKMQVFDRTTKNALELKIVKALKYETQNGRIEDHIDGLKGYVIIFSIGNIAKFRCKSAAIGEKYFDFASGDVLMFDTSKEAAVEHGISHIEEGTCPAFLSLRYPEISTCRICVQMRLV
ncbi:hypothetical protein RFI_28928 [Reticulomyxa filosa]|uniref:Uncharacterized protein n=1 Tax=Reticulomyxa filosa TaxID=46433 RepID=X6M603_RETFI|nr:hypothetical protein RFI_28928 [Reticulomyxa filosa]|eukprot:ETO08460.1 hypothetical protein RFI_28928 [Reticulomyxa filosa]